MYTRLALCALLLALAGCMEGQKAEPLPRKSPAVQSTAQKALLDVAGKFKEPIR